MKTVIPVLEGYNKDGEAVFGQKEFESQLDALEWARKFMNDYERKHKLQEVC